MAKAKNVGVVVTTSHRDVWFGFLDKMPVSAPKSVRLRGARHGYYWGTGIDGLGALAATGPGAGAKIGAAVTDLVLGDVVAVMQCSDTARLAWEAGKWAR